MADLVMLVALCVAMLGGSFLAGVLALSVNLSERKLRFISALGAGLLVGAALAVIIPEGIHAVDAGATVNYRNAARHCEPRNALMAAESLPPVVADKIIDARNEKGVDVSKTGMVENIPLLADDAHELLHETCPKRDTHSVIGLSLVLGFVLMLVIDYYSSRKSTAAASSHLTATLGLLVHAAADGIALGASAVTSEVDLELIVFVAIMLHKAPAAFGLVSFLLHEGVERHAIRRHLLTFSLAAPITALATFGFLQLWNQNYGASSSLSPLSTGSVLLFSGGTFLYVATVHVLPEVAHQSGHHEQQSAPAANSWASAAADRASPVNYQLLSNVEGKDFPVLNNNNHADAESAGGETVIIRQPVAGGVSSPPGAKAQLEALDLVALIVGCLCPLLFAVGHTH